MTVSGPDGDGMVALAAAELDEPLRVASDWPVHLARWPGAQPQCPKRIDDRE